MKVNKTIMGVLVGVVVIATVLDLKYKGMGYKMLPEAVQQAANTVFNK